MDAFKGSMVGAASRALAFVTSGDVVALGLLLSNDMRSRRGDFLSSGVSGVRGQGDARQETAPAGSFPTSLISHP